MFDFIAKIFKLGRYRARSGEQSVNNRTLDGTSALHLGTQAAPADPQTAEPIDDIELRFSVWANSRVSRETKSTKAAAAYWQEGTSKYKRRQSNNNNDLKTFYGYFDALKENPQLRTNEFENPGTGLDCHVSSLINNSIRAKMIGQYVARSQKAIDAMIDRIPECEFEIESENLALEGSELLDQQTVLMAPMCDIAAPNFAQLSASLSELCELSSSLSKLAVNSNEDLKSMIAECTTLPYEIFDVLAADENLDIKYCIAENYACPVNVLAKLAEDENPYVAHRARRTLCKLHDSGSEIPQSEPHPIAEAQAAEKLNISDVWHEPQQATVKPYWQQPLTLHETEELSELFDVQEDTIGETYNNWLLSLAEAANTESIEQSVSTDVIWMLIDDPNPDVRFCLAENYNIDEEMLERLAKDENPYVAHRANKTLMRLRPTIVLDKDFRSRADERRKTG